MSSPVADNYQVALETALIRHLWLSIGCVYSLILAIAFCF